MSPKQVRQGGHNTHQATQPSVHPIFSSGSGSLTNGSLPAVLQLSHVSISFSSCKCNCCLVQPKSYLMVFSLYKHCHFVAICYCVLLLLLLCLVLWSNENSHTLSAPDNALTSVVSHLLTVIYVKTDAWWTHMRPWQSQSRVPQCLACPLKAQMQ